MLADGLPHYLQASSSTKPEGHFVNGRPVGVLRGEDSTGKIADMKVNGLTEQIIGAAIDVHRALGPGLLESVYEACLWHELTERNVYAERQKALPVFYKGLHIDCGYRIDLLVEREVIVELKAITRLEPIHQAQLLSYLRLSARQVGLLINFNVKQLTTGVRRLVNALPE